MNPNQLNDQELDAFIEEALKAEPMRAVPTGFHKRVDARLKVSALVQGERHRLRVRMAATMAIIATAAVVIVGVPVFAFFQGWMTQQMPGSQGYADYLLLSLNQVWQVLGVKGFALCATALAVLGMAALAPAFTGALAKNR